jgi:molybdenum cofactor cytidylyltransferase
MSTAALVLAAGGSSRLGRPKQLLPWETTSLLGHVTAAVRTWPVDLVCVVLGSRASEVWEAVDLRFIEVVVNPEWESGMASSLRAGLCHLATLRNVEAAFIAMGDQPAIDDSVPGALVAVRSRTGLPAAAPVYRGVRSNPVLFERSLWPFLMTLDGDQGARRFLHDHPELVAEVEFDLPPPRSINTEQDYEELRPA